MNNIKTIEERKEIIKRINNDIEGLQDFLDSTSNNRDTQGWAIKCSSIEVAVDGNPMTGTPSYIEERDVFKDPITAPNKKSKKGRITTYIRPDGTYFVDKVNKTFEDGSADALETVFENGEMIKEISFKDIRGW